MLDASVLVKWFRPEGEANVTEALLLRRLYDTGRLSVVVPQLLYLEMLNNAARRWHWDSLQLAEWVNVLIGFAFRAAEPSLYGVARWAALGLTAYDACYLALAEERRTFVVTADEQILRLGGRWARSIGQAALDLTVEGS